MNIEEFFELSAGKWFAHRTTHGVVTNQMQEAKSEIIFEKLSATDSEVIRLCEACQVNPNSQIIGAKVNWNDTTRLNQKNVGTAILVLIPNQDNTDEGQLLRQVNKGEQPLTGHYKLASDKSLTLTLKSGNTSSEEKLWYASDNLRMRVSAFKQADGLSMSSFTTEIRMGGSTAKTSQTANSASN